MRAEHAPRPLLQVAAVTAGLASGATHAAEWMATPSASVSAQTQRNPYLQTDDESQRELSTGLGTQASLNLARESEQWSLALKPNVSIYRYPDKDQLDRDEEHLSASMNYRGERSAWAGTINAARDTTLTSELGSTGLTQGNQRHELYEVSIGPTWQVAERVSTRLSVGSSVTRYPGRRADGLENYRYDSGSVAVSYVLSDRALVSLSGSAGRLNSDSQDHSDNASVMVNGQYAWSPVWNVSAGAGPSLLRVRETREHGIVYMASLSRTFERASLSLSASRSQQPSGTALITNVEQAGLSFGGAATEQLSVSASASYIRRSNAFRDFNLDLNRVRYARLDAGLSWRVSPSWQVGAGVGASTQKTGSLFFNDETGRGYDVRVSVSWNGKPYVH